MKFKNIFVFMLSILITAGAGIFLNSRLLANVARASVAQNVSGFAWSENIGWISFNSINCDTNGDGQSEGGVGCPASGSPITPYGVNIDRANGSISGWAWSENIGWMKFDPAPDSSTGNYPQNPQTPAKFNPANGSASGWARACAGTLNSDCASANRTDGWDGWIKLAGSGQDGSSYGVSFACPSSGYAWGSDVVGWIKFGGTAQSGSSYGVLAFCPPSAVNLLAIAPDYCSSGPAEIFSWTFQDFDPGSAQSAYQLQVDDNSDFSSLVVDSGKVVLSSSAYATPAGTLAYGKTYYWRVKVWDNTDMDSGWISGGQFSTPAHAAPSVDFTWVTDPDNNLIKTFADQSIVYCGGCAITRAWQFQDGVPAGSSASPVSVTFTSGSSSKNATLTITDDIHTCSATKAISTRRAFRWRELLPW